MIKKNKGKKYWNKERRLDNEFNDGIKNKKYIKKEKYKKDIFGEDEEYWDKYDYWFYKYDHNDN